MHCKQARQQIDRLSQPAHASSELTQHTAQCGLCAKLLEERMALHVAFAGLRAETAELGPSANVEQQVLAALRATPLNPHRPRHKPRWVVTAGLAFAALLVAGVLFTLARPHHVAPIAALPHEEPFTAMPYVVPPTPSEPTTIVRTRVSTQIVQDAGLQVRDDAGSTALADVVLDQDGRILALRLVSHPHSPSPSSPSPRRID